ncbi:hypothetical protein [Aquabacterium sp.]|uniref:hypothetical protein n=1 Tax=Aquabacterium sp. TaxID=1872578 RepID=UPI0025BA810A|nr:hypothetical protein [Aquabacterium sp.]
MEQSACLLRTVHVGGVVDAAPAKIPDGMRHLVDRPMRVWKDALRKHIALSGLTEKALGGSLDAPLSSVLREDGGRISAHYFVIHDTSWPWLDAQPFPIDTDSQVNDLGFYAHASTAMAHVFVNRLGKTLTTHEFEEPWRATKLENKVIGLHSRGLFLHVELVQPRRRDTNGPAGNDALAPEPGFTTAQYDTLALLYMAASVRAGFGLVPGLHAAIDDGLTGGHDDPQNFQLEEFAAALIRLQTRLSALSTNLVSTDSALAKEPGVR